MSHDPTFCLEDILEAGERILRYLKSRSVLSSSRGGRAARRHAIWAARHGAPDVDKLERGRRHMGLVRPEQYHGRVKVDEMVQMGLRRPLVILVVADLWYKSARIDSDN